MAALPKLAVWKFASCNGCQLSLLNLEDELLALSTQLEIAYFPELTRRVSPGPYDLSLVEGSISTAEDAERILEIRAESKRLITIGACATAGGIQALRNFADSDAYRQLVYPHPEFIQTLPTSTPISEHVAVDYELPGCPINKAQLLELIKATLAARRPQIADTSVCSECKAENVVCVAVARGTPCLGPITRSGCGALCPRHDRGCYGCFGPKESANPDSLRTQWQAAGISGATSVRLLRSFTAWAPPFRAASEAQCRDNEND